MASANVLPPISAQERSREPPPPPGTARSLSGRLPSSKEHWRKKTMTGESYSRKEQEMVDPASYRHSVFHNICTALLRDGFHESFTELFTLVERQRAEHERAGPAAVLLPPLIEHSRDKLDLLRHQLSSAEEAKRASDLDSAYLAQRELALHFEQAGDRWLSDHFHQRCLDTGRMVKGDNRRKEGEAHFHVALSYENRGKLVDAVQHMVTFHQLARSHRWHTEAGDSMHRIGCEHLRRIYTKMADQAPGPKEAIQLLQKAQSIAREGGDSFQEGMAYHRLGLAHERIADFDSAIQCHKSYLDRCRYHGDEERVGEAYNALARCYERKGDLENAVQCLELYVGVAEKAGLVKPLAKACSAAGVMFNTLADYGKAVEYFQRCYKLCQQLGDKEALEGARVQCGIAQAHHNLVLFSGVIGHQSDSTLCQLVAWKAGRVVPTGEEEEQEEEEEEEECEEEELLNKDGDIDSEEREQR